MCKTSPYITEEFCKHHSLLFRPEIAEYTLVPIALGMVLAKKPQDYGSDEWRTKFTNYMINIYQCDCTLYDQYHKDDEDWQITRKNFYTEDHYKK